MENGIKHGIIVDDDPYLVESVLMLFNYTNSMETGYDLKIGLTSGNELIDYLKINCKKIDFVILDLGMESICGIDVLRSIRSKYPKIKFIIYSGKLNPVFIKEIFRLGVNGCVMKAGGTKALPEAISIVLNDQIYICSNSRYELKEAEEDYKDYLKSKGNSLDITFKKIKNQLIDNEFNDSTISLDKEQINLEVLHTKELVEITPKEEIVIEELLSYKSNFQIAESLEISYNTARTHKRNLYKKFNSFNMQSLISSIKDTSVFYLRRPNL